MQLRSWCLETQLQVTLYFGDCGPSSILSWLLEELHGLQFAICLSPPKKSPSAVQVGRTAEPGSDRPSCLSTTLYCRENLTSNWPLFPLTLLKDVFTFMSVCLHVLCVLHTYGVPAKSRKWVRSPVLSYRWL